MRQKFTLSTKFSSFDRGVKFIALMLIGMLSSGLNAQTATQMNVTGTGTLRYISNNVASVVDSNLTITANGNLNGFIVSITDSYTSGDVLSYTGTLPSGVTAAAFNTATKSLVFSGTTSASNWQALLRTVRITTTSATCSPEQRDVTFTASNKYYNPVNGHYYEYYSTTGSWTSAIAAVSSKSYFGRQCYMATLTSAAENSFVMNLIGMNSWMGCSDNYLQVNAALGYTAYANQAAADGNWYWVTGPERGIKINNKNSWGSGGINPVSGVYNNWSSGEPNDWPGTNSSSPGEEDYGHVYSSTGDWNDFANTQSIGTIFEYGGMPNDSTSSSVHFTRSIYINGAPSGTINGGNVTVCSGTNSTTLMLTGLTGSVVRWQSSTDNFISNSTNISNTTTSLTVSNISANTYYRAVVNTSSGCSNLATSSTLITVASTVAGNIVAANNTICAGGAASFTLYGNVGSVVRWQVSTSSSFASGVTNINVTTTNLNYTLASTGTYYFRAVVQYNSCGTPLTTPGYSISVISGTNPVGGTVGNAEHCGGTSNSGTVTLTGHTGTISKWQSSIDGGTVWTDIANTTATYSYSGVGVNTKFRAVLVNGSCGIAYSNAGTVYVYGTTATKWVGGTSTAWNTSSNWCGGVGDNGIDIVVSPSAAYNMILDQTRIVGNINFNGSSVNIYLGNNDLTVASFSSASSTSYIRTNGTGKLKMSIQNGQSKQFPVGTTSFTPLTITNNTGSADYLSVRVFDGVYNTGYSGYTTTLGRVNKTWDISKATANGGSGLNFVFNWNSGDVVNLSTPTLYHFENGAWNQQTGTSSSTSTSLTYTGYTGTFSPFAVGNSLTPLPVNWVSFVAEANGDNSSVLSWETASERNASHFDVMKSSDGNNWSFVGKVNAKGNTNSISYYSYTDNQVLPVTYYQIWQYDLNGELNKSETRTVVLAPVRKVSVYPNPSKGQIEITAGLNSRYTIMDMNGKMVSEGIVGGVLHLSDLESGVYLVNVTEGEEIRSFKLVVE